MSPKMLARSGLVNQKQLLAHFINFQVIFFNGPTTYKFRGKFAHFPWWANILWLGDTTMERAALRRLLEAERLRRGEERPRDKGARAAAARPRRDHREWERAERDGRGK